MSDRLLVCLKKDVESCNPHQFDAIYTEDRELGALEHFANFGGPHKVLIKSPELFDVLCEDWKRLYDEDKVCNNFEDFIEYREFKENKDRSLSPKSQES